MQGLLELQERRKLKSSEDQSLCFPDKKKDSSALTQTEKNSCVHSFVHDELTDLFNTYEIILEMQQQVYDFLHEKFTSGKRIDYVRGKMDFVKEEIGRLKNIHPKNV
jgi:hypothetical protein